MLRSEYWANTPARTGNAQSPLEDEDDDEDGPQLWWGEAPAGLKDLAKEGHVPQDIASNASDLPSRVCQLTGRLIYPRQRPLSHTGWQPLNGSAALDTIHHRLRARLVALRTTSVLIGASPHHSRASARV
jgi:hypothetical protein